MQKFVENEQTSWISLHLATESDYSSLNRPIDTIPSLARSSLITPNSQLHFHYKEQIICDIADVGHATFTAKFNLNHFVVYGSKWLWIHCLWNRKGTCWPRCPQWFVYFILSIIPNEFCQNLKYKWVHPPCERWRLLNSYTGSVPRAIAV